MTKANENALERLLRLAQAEPGYRPEFYKLLLKSEVFALVPAPALRPLDDVIRFVQWLDPDGHDVVPIFSSRIRIRRALTPETNAFCIKGRALLAATRGATIVLDPNDSVSCRLEPWDVAALLDSGAISAPVPWMLSEQRRVAMGTFTTPPSQMIASLTVLFSRIAHVGAAYLVGMSYVETPDEISILIGILVDPEMLNDERAVREAFVVIEDANPDRYLVDIVVFRGPEDPIRASMQKVTSPFYERRWGAKLMEPDAGGNA